MMREGFAVRSTGRPMDFNSGGACSAPNELAFRATGPASVQSAAVKLNDDDDDDEGENDVPEDGQDDANVDEASLIDDYFGLSDVTTTSGQCAARCDN